MELKSYCGPRPSHGLQADEVDPGCKNEGNQIS